MVPSRRRCAPLQGRCADMKRVGRRVRGQCLIEYAVLVAAVSLGVVMVANLVYRAFTGHARTIEDTQIVF